MMLAGLLDRENGSFNVVELVPEPETHLNAITPAHLDLLERVLGGPIAAIEGPAGSTVVVNLAQNEGGMLARALGRGWHRAEDADDGLGVPRLEGSGLTVNEIKGSAVVLGAIENRKDGGAFCADLTYEQGAALEELLPGWSGFEVLHRTDLGVCQTADEWARTYETTSLPSDERQPGGWRADGDTVEMGDASLPHVGALFESSWAVEANMRMFADMGDAERAGYHVERMDGDIGPMLLTEYEMRWREHFDSQIEEQEPRYKDMSKLAQVTYHDGMEAELGEEGPALYQLADGSFIACDHDEYGEVWTELSTLDAVAVLANLLSRDEEAKDSLDPLVNYDFWPETSPAAFAAAGGLHELESQLGQNRP